MRRVWLFVPLVLAFVLGFMGCDEGPTEASYSEVTASFNGIPANPRYHIRLQVKCHPSVASADVNAWPKLVPYPGPLDLEHMDCGYDSGSIYLNPVLVDFRVNFWVDFKSGGYTFCVYPDAELYPGRLVCRDPPDGHGKPLVTLKVSWPQK